MVEPTILMTNTICLQKEYAILVHTNIWSQLDTICHYCYNQLVDVDMLYGLHPWKMMTIQEVNI